MGSTARIFGTSALLLYLEVALLRWMGAFVPFASFFTHHVLLGALLGVSLGFFLGDRPEGFLRRSPWVLFATLASGALFHLLHAEGLLGVRVGDPANPDRLFFGTIWPSWKAKRIALPVEATLLAAFVGSTWVCAGLGQRLGRRFAAAPGRLLGYGVHLLGCVVGTLAFAFLAALGVSPGMALLPALLLLGFEVRGARGASRSGTWIGLTACAALLVYIDLPREGFERHGSPYGRIDYGTAQRVVHANGIGHQQIVDQGRAGQAYGLPYALCRASDGKAPERVLVLGAGTGNDVAMALAQGASHVDAVEIDPVLAELGRRHHPDRPYQDPRVRLWIEDGRRFLETSNESYDLIVFGLVDSLTLHSSYGSVRLESYLFTEEAFEAARRRLRPGGRVALLNYLRSGWLALRIAALCERVFGQPPKVFSLPHRDRIGEELEPDDALSVILGGAPSVATVEFDGLTHRAARLEPTSQPLPTDDWPYPYLRERAVPPQNLRALAGLLLCGSLLLLGARVPVLGSLRRRYLFLGVGFALIEATSIGRLAAVFGTTWHVHAVVVCGVLGASLAGTLWVGWRPKASVPLLYLGLFGALGLSASLDAATLLALPRPVAGIGVLSPVFFSGAIFARAYARESSVGSALGSNSIGVLLGIALEGLSVVTGMRGMVAWVALAYAASLPLGRWRS